MTSSEPTPDAATAAGSAGPDENVTVPADPLAEAFAADAATSAAGPAPDGGPDEPTVPLADLQRLQADFTNFRRRAAKEKESAAAFGKQILLEKLLPVLDDLDRARAHGDLGEGSPLRGVADKLAETLTAQGLSPFGAPGEPFDADLHEAVQHDGDGASPVIGAVYRSGYRLGERVIRTAMVTVTDPAPETGAGQGD
ncbi:nucleotide exchange factor GrpE [Gordonia sp. TBRC 11910]|uniref:Protein GrpE n=1 Tax=Gordonia asplenii TaxID=2725283 RepID=A0A848KUY6_9ACTN|nr:nucleotide exchange factor GrpE [Gordonia asplenii]NMO02694.1 nucleotide exchange factor GrpE [Gordonia asplenii]